MSKSKVSKAFLLIGARGNCVNENRIELNRLQSSCFDYIKDVVLLMETLPNIMETPPKKCSLTLP